MRYFGSNAYRGEGRAGWVTLWFSGALARRYQLAEHHEKNKELSMSDQSPKSILLTTKRSAGDIRLGPRTSVLPILFCALSLLGLWNAHDAKAATINIDFEDSGQSATHQGDDGILSLPGQSVWNRVFVPNGLNPTENLVDASGNSTDVSYRSIDSGGHFTSYSQSDLR